MSLSEEKKQEVRERFRVHEKDNGSTPLQIATLTERINILAAHLEKNKKDESSRKGLLLLVARRRKLLDYLRRKDEERYIKMLKELGLRR